MDKIASVFNFFQNAVLRSSNVNEIREKRENNSAAKYCVGLDAFKPVGAKESFASLASRDRFCVGHGTLDVINEKLNGYSFGEPVDVAKEKATKIPQKDVKKAVLRSQFQRSCLKVFQSKSLKQDLEKTSENDAKPIKREAFLPSINVQQPKQNTLLIKNRESAGCEKGRFEHDKTKLGHNLPDIWKGSELSSQKSKGAKRGGEKKKSKGKVTDKKSSRNDNKERRLPDIHTTTGKPRMSEKCRIGFLEDILLEKSQSVRSAEKPAELPRNDKSYSMSGGSKKPCAAVPNLELEVDKNDIMATLKSREEASGNSVQKGGKVQAECSSYSRNLEEVYKMKTQRQRPTSSLGRWIKKRSNSVAPAPMDDLCNPSTDEMSESCRNEQASNVGEPRGNKNETVGKDEKIKRRNGKCGSPSAGDMACSVFVKQRTENPLTLSLNDTTRDVQELATKNEVGFDKLSGREGLSSNGSQHRQMGNTDIEPTQVPERTMYQLISGKTFGPATERPGSTQKEHRGVNGPSPMYKQKTANYLSDSNRNLPKIDRRVNGCSKKPRLPSIVEADGLINETIYGLSGKKNGCEVGKDTLQWRESVTQLRESTKLKQASTVKAPRYSRHQMEIQCEGMSSKQEPGFLPSIFDQPANGTVFLKHTEDLSGPSHTRKTPYSNQQKIHWRFPPTESRASSASRPSSCGPSRLCRLYDDLTVTDLDDLLDY